MTKLILLNHGLFFNHGPLFLLQFKWIFNPNCKPLQLSKRKFQSILTNTKHICGFFYFSNLSCVVFYTLHINNTKKSRLYSYKCPDFHHKQPTNQYFCSMVYSCLLNNSNANVVPSHKISQLHFDFKQIVWFKSLAR